MKDLENEIIILNTIIADKDDEINDMRLEIMDYRNKLRELDNKFELVKKILDKSTFI